MAMDDIAPHLMEQLQTRFMEKISLNPKIRAMEKKINAGNATYVDAEDYAYLIGEALSQTFGEILSSSVLPDGRMYFNIADRVLRPLLVNDHKIVSDAAALVQTALNRKANIGIKAQTVAVNEDRIYGIVNKVADATNFDDVAWMLNEPVKNFSMNVVDETLRVNVNFQGGAGLRPRIIRKSERKCCEWCSQLTGEYEYPDVPDDIYRRHERCRCTVEYDPADGKRMRQNVHTKQWTEDKEGHVAGYQSREKAIRQTEQAEKFKRTFNAVPQDKVVSVMRKDSTEWIESLTEAERNSITKYTGNSDNVPKFYQRLNSMLRGETSEDDSLRRHANIISSALQRSILKSNVICYRGLDINPIPGAECGALVNLRQFTSTSVIDTKAFNAPVNMVIYAKQGTCGAAYIEALSQFENQRELLFDKDCWYRVLSNKDNKIELEVL